MIVHTDECIINSRGVSAHVNDKVYLDLFIQSWTPTNKSEKITAIYPDGCIVLNNNTWLHVSGIADFEIALRCSKKDNGGVKVSTGA